MDIKEIQPEINLLWAYTKYLKKEGLLDADFFTEPPSPLDGFISEYFKD